MQHHTTIEGADLVWAFANLCTAFRVPFDARLFLQEFPPPYHLATLSRAAAALGLKLRTRALGARELAKADLPAVAMRELSPGTGCRIGLVLSADSEALLVTERDTAPREVAHEEFAARYGTELLLVEPVEEAPAHDGEFVAPRFGLGWFVPELRRHRNVWRDVLAASLVLQAIGLLTPLGTQVIIDKVVVHQTQSTLTVILIALGISVVFGAALAYTRQYLLLYAGNRIDAVLGMRVFEHLLRLPPRYFEQRATGTLVARLQGVETIREFITGAAASIVLDVPFVMIFLALMLYYSVDLTLIAVAAIAVLAVLSIAVTPLLRRRINQQFLLGARNQAFLTEYISAMDTVKSLQMEPRLAERHGRNLAEFLGASFATRNLANAYSVLANTIEQALAVSILGLGAWLVITTQEFTIGMLVAFQMFASRLAQPALRLAGLWQEFQQAAIAVQRLGDLMDAPAEVYAMRATRTGSRAGGIDMEKVSFRYREDQAAVFENFSLKIEAGACVALLGASGSGKSTLARLLLGFCVPSAGSIRIDGQDTRQVGVNELRLAFGVVPQETRLFSGTLFDNLLHGQPHASLAEVTEACRQSEIHTFIESLPQGYQTRVGEHGAGLSGGQKQRIAIARALLRHPRILLFDEATASLDHDTAEAIGQTISRLRGQVTIIFIAHQVPASLEVDAVARIERKNVMPVKSGPMAGET